jgi:drug/metabolite transporter (DMT)-like permease
MKTKSTEQAVVYMIYSSLFLSLLNFSVKSCIGPLGVTESAFLRYFAPLVMVLPILAWKNSWHYLRPRVKLSLHFLRGLFAAIAQLSLTYYLTKATLVNATTFWATGPLYIPIIVHFLYKQKTPKVTWLSIVICFIGVLMMVKPSEGIFDTFSIWGLIGGLATAFAQTLWGRNAEKGSITENLFYLYLFAASLCLAGWFIFGSEGQVSFPNTLLLWFAILGIALTSLGNQLFRSKAYQITSSNLLTPILYVAVVGSGILDIVFYNIWPDIWGYIGFAFVAAGTLIKWWYLRKYQIRTL